MKEISPRACDSCGDKILRSSVVWGLEGERRRKNVVIVLQSSDEREGSAYEEALFESRTGRIIWRVVEGKTDDVVITNAVKCLPLDRYKTPVVSVVDNCRSHLANLVDHFPNGGVLCVGSIALASFAPQLSGCLADYRGQVLNLDGRPVLAVGHFGRAVTREEINLATEFIRSLRRR